MLPQHMVSTTCSLLWITANPYDSLGKLKCFVMLSAGSPAEHRTGGMQRTIGQGLEPNFVKNIFG